MHADENDNTPSLRVLNAQLEEGLELPENRASGALVGYAFASDADSGANGAVTCRTASSSFRLEAPQDEEARALSAQSVSQHAAPTQTYRIVAARTFDREQTRIASFSIVCEDAGPVQIHYRHYAERTSRVACVSTGLNCA